MATFLVLESTSTTGKKIRKAITDVNPNVSNANLKTFGQMANALTTNTYGSSARVDKDELQPASALKTYSAFQYNVVGASNWKYFAERNIATVTFSDLFGDSTKPNYGCLLIKIKTEDSNSFLLSTEWIVEVVSTPADVPVLLDGSVNNQPSEKIIFGIPSNEAKFLGDYVFRIPERDGYAPVEFTVRITADE